jgi:hypothetical protein
MCVIAEPRAVGVRSSYQFDEEIGAASAENGLFIAKMEFSVRTAVKKQKQERRDLSPLEFPTRSGAGEVYAYEIRILKGFGVRISTSSRQA